jgi:hypothetical protein
MGFVRKGIEPNMPLRQCHQTDTGGEGGEGGRERWRGKKKKTEERKEEVEGRGERTPELKDFVIPRGFLSL